MLLIPECPVAGCSCGSSRVPLVSPSVEADDVAAAVSETWCNMLAAAASPSLRGAALFVDDCRWGASLMQWRALNLAKAPYTAYKASTCVTLDATLSAHHTSRLHAV